MNTDNHAHLLEEALAAGRARDYPTAIRFLTRLITVTDRYPHAILYLGRSYHALGQYNKAVPVLERLALEGDTGEQIAAARALGGMNRPQTVAFLRDYIARHRGEAVARLAAARASGRVELMRALLDEPEVAVRQKAVFELARKGDRVALDVLHADLKSKSYAVRHRAAWALYRVGDKSGLLVLARDRLRVQQWSLADNAGKYLNYIDGVLGDKRPVVKALVDTVTAFIDEVEANGTSGDYPTTGRSLNFIHLQLAKCTGKKFFNWPRFKASKEAREQLKQRWLDYWEQEGRKLPEVVVKPGNPRVGDAR